MTKLRHYDDWGTARFVTFSCYRRVPRLADDRVKKIFLRHLEAARNKHRFKLLGYVIMPDHVHLVIFPPDGMKLGLVIREIKSHTAREYFAKIETDVPPDRRVFWTRRCYDHNCRSTETVYEKIGYCHRNPVQRGLVSEPGEWIWSSFDWYAGKDRTAIELDVLGTR